MNSSLFNGLFVQLSFAAAESEDLRRRLKEAERQSDEFRSIVFSGASATFRGDAIMESRRPFGVGEEREGRSPLTMTAPVSASFLGHRQSFREGYSAASFPDPSRKQEKEWRSYGAEREDREAVEDMLTEKMTKEGHRGEERQKESGIDRARERALEEKEEAGAVTFGTGKWEKSELSSTVRGPATFAGLSFGSVSKKNEVESEKQTGSLHLSRSSVNRSSALAEGGEGTEEVEEDIEVEEETEGEESLGLPSLPPRRTLAPLR